MFLKFKNKFLLNIIELKSEELFIYFHNFVRTPDTELLEIF